MESALDGLKVLDFFARARRAVLHHAAGAVWSGRVQGGGGRWAAILDAAGVRRSPAISVVLRGRKHRQSGVSIDLSARRHQLCLRLGNADVLLENYRPGTIGRSGWIPGRARQPIPAVYCSISGSGKKGHRAMNLRWISSCRPPAG